MAPVPAVGADAPLALTDIAFGDGNRVDVTVTAPGRFREDIPAEAFTVSEDGEQRAAEVRRVSSDDLEVVLALDNSGSMGVVPMEAVKAAALSFVEVMPPRARLAVVEFNTAAHLLAGFTHDRAAVVNAIAGLTSGGRTALFDAVHLAVSAFDFDHDARRVIVLVADGEDNNSTTTLPGSADLLRHHDIVLHVVALTTGVSDLAALQELASAGGGEMISIDDPAGLDEVYRGLAAGLTDQYHLSYVSQAHDPAVLTVRFAHQGLEAEAAREIQLPAAADPEPAPDPPEETREEDVPPLAGGLRVDPHEPIPWVSRRTLLLGVAVWVGLFVLWASIVGGPRRRPPPTPRPPR